MRWINLSSKPILSTDENVIRYNDFRSNFLHRSERRNIARILFSAATELDERWTPIKKAGRLDKKRLVSEMYLASSSGLNEETRKRAVHLPRALFITRLPINSLWNTLHCQRSAARCEIYYNNCTHIYREIKRNEFPFRKTYLERWLDNSNENNVSSRNVGGQCRLFRYARSGADRNAVNRRMAWPVTDVWFSCPVSFQSSEWIGRNFPPPNTPRFHPKRVRIGERRASDMIISRGEKITNRKYVPRE